MSQSIPSDCRYTKDHEWTKADGDEVLVGITAFAVEQLGDITLVNIDLAEGDSVAEGMPFGTVESVKTLADLFAPISGTISRINPKLEEEPELVNDDCYGEGWMIALKPDDASSAEQLLDADGYAKLLADT